MPFLNPRASARMHERAETTSTKMRPGADTASAQQASRCLSSAIVMECDSLRDDERRTS